jgi:Lysophospholipase L1 and related esterases
MTRAHGIIVLKLLVLVAIAGYCIFSFKPQSLASPQTKKHMYTYLALGDSYTIGEQVAMQDNFPYQLVSMLKKDNFDIADPVIIAKTGWTTDELAMAIREHNITDTFSVVTLLIGVNNQYRGRDVQNYTEEFTQLLDQAIAFAGGEPEHVFVVSIPDWGVTPFAEGKDREQIAKEINAYNSVKEAEAKARKCHYVEITESTRRNGNNALYLAEDKLHPSAKEYEVWAAKLTPAIAKALKK